MGSQLDLDDVAVTSDLAMQELLEMRAEIASLRAENERLSSIISDIKDWDCDVRGGFLSIPLGLRRRIQNALAAYHKQKESDHD